MLAVILLYCAINAAYLYALPVTAIAQQDAIGQAAAQVLFSPVAAYWITAVIAIACFSATSSNILAGARISYAMAHDGLFFRRMGKVHPQHRTPAFALIAQGALACVFALSGTYDQLFTYTVFGMILSYVATVGALFVLRRTRPDMPRPYRCWGLSVDAGAVPGADRRLAGEHHLRAAAGGGVVPGTFGDRAAGVFLLEEKLLALSS